MKVSSIVAMGNNRVIGKNNQMMWHVPSEFNHYRKLLGEHLFVIGRKNYEGSVNKLNSKRAIILTRNLNYDSNLMVANSPEESLELAHKLGEKELFIMGGEQVYREFMPIIDTLYLSVINFQEEGDTYFPRHEHINWKTKRFFEKEVDGETPISWKFFELVRN